MKVDLTDNIVAVMEECSVRLINLRDEQGEPGFDVCNLCPLRGACMEHFTGDSSENC